MWLQRDGDPDAAARRAAPAQRRSWLAAGSRALERAAAVCLQQDGHMLPAGRKVDAAPEQAGGSRFCSALGLIIRSGPGMLAVEPGRFLTTFSRGFNPGLGPRQAHIVVQALYQLGVVCHVLPVTANTAGQREVVAAFARTAGRPQLVLPWLLSISQALLDLPLGSCFNAPQTTGKCWEGC